MIVIMHVQLARAETLCCLVRRKVKCVEKVHKRQCAVPEAPIGHERDTAAVESSKKEWRFTYVCK